MKRVLIATLGSLGDLHPCFALGTELKRRGHQVTVASTPLYRGRAEALGLGFRGLRPDWDPTDSEIIRRCEDLKREPEVLFRELVLPHLKVTYEDLPGAVMETDVMIAGELVYGAPLVAEKRAARWVSAILSTCSFFSSLDPSILVTAPWLIHFRKAGWLAYRVALDACRLATWHWWNPVRELRREIGLSADCDPVFRDKFFAGAGASPVFEAPCREAAGLAQADCADRVCLF